METKRADTPKIDLVEEAVRAACRLADTLHERIPQPPRLEPNGYPATISSVLRQYIAKLDQYELTGVPDGAGPAKPPCARISEVCYFLELLSESQPSKPPEYKAQSRDLVAESIKTICIEIEHRLGQGNLQRISTVADCLEALEGPPVIKKARPVSRRDDGVPKNKPIPSEKVADNQRPRDDEKPTVGRLSEDWHDFFKDTLIPCRLEVVIDDRSIDLHDVWAALPRQRQGQQERVRNPWKPYPFNEAEKCPAVSRYTRDLRIDQSKLFKSLPAAEYPREMVEHGLPCPRMFAPVDVSCNGKLLTIERSIFGFYRVAPEALQNIPPGSIIKARYVPSGHNVRRNEARMCAWAGKIQQALYHHTQQNLMEHLPLEAQDEILLAQSDNRDWHDSLRQVIIALNLGYSTGCSQLDGMVGQNLNEHLLARRLGSCFHQSIVSIFILSTIFRALDKPSVLVGGIFFDVPRSDHIEVWTLDRSWGWSRILRVDPTRYSSLLSDEQERKLAAFTSSAATNDSRPVDAVELGWSARESVGSIPYNLGKCGTEDAEDDHRGRGQGEFLAGRFRGADLERYREGQLSGSGRLPLRVELRRCAERLQRDGRCDELLKLYLSRRKEIRRDLNARQSLISSSMKAAQGPGFLITELLRAAFREGSVTPGDLAAKTTTTRRWDTPVPLGAELLADEEILADLGTTELQIFQILRRSPLDLAAVFHSRLKTALKPPPKNSDEPPQPYLNKTDPWCATLARACRQMAECINSHELATHTPLQEQESQFVGRDEPFCRLFGGLVSCFQVACQIRDEQLRNSIRLAGEAIGRCFPEIPPFFDYQAYAESHERRHQGQQAPYFDQAFTNLLASVVRTNAKAAQYFRVTGDDHLVLTTNGGLRFARNWSERLSGLPANEYNESGYVENVFEKREVDYLSFLCGRMTVSEDVRSLIGTTIRDDLSGPLSRILGVPGMPMPIAPYPMTSLVLLSKQNKFPSLIDRLGKLREIGVLGDNLASNKSAQTERELCRLAAASPVRVSQDGDLTIALQQGNGTSIKLHIPRAAVLRSALGSNSIKFSEDDRVVLAMYPELPVSRTSSRPPLTRSEACWYDAVLRQLREAVPDVHNNLILATTQAATLEAKPSPLVLDRDAYYEPQIQRAEGVLSVGLLYELVKGYTSENNFFDRAGSMRAAIRSDIAQRGGVAHAKGYDHNSLPKIPGSGDFIRRAGSHVPHYFALCRPTDLPETVVDAWAAREKLGRWHHGDTVEGKWCPVSPAECAVRLLLASGSAFSADLRVSDIKSMATALTSQTGFRGWPEPLRGPRRGPADGTRRSHDRCGEFESLSIVPPGADVPVGEVYWLKSAGDGALYKRNTVSGEERRVTVIINAAPIRMAAWEKKGGDPVYQVGTKWTVGPTNTVKNLLSQIVTASLLAPSTRFMVRSHGAVTLHFSMRDLDYDIPLPLTGAALQSAQDLKTPLERLIAMLTIAGALGHQRAALAHQCSLFEMTQEDRRPLVGNRFVLVSDIDGLPTDREALRPMVRGPLYCIEVVPPTHEVSLHIPRR